MQQSLPPNVPAEGAVLPLQRFVGWAALTVSLAVVSFLGFWGIQENFHQGWHHPALLMRLVMTLAYLSPMFLFMGLSLASLRWPRIGLVLHSALAVFALWFFSASPAAVQMIAVPAVVIGLAYFWGRPQNLRLAVELLVAAPLLVVLVSGAAPAWKVATRVDDGDRGRRRLTANGVDLIWAPAGPGWTTQGVDWHEAMRRSRHLTEDGRTLADSPQNIWRLPTVEQVVRSHCRHGENCGGRWDESTGKATYIVTPDKESPLWDVHSAIIYWWTSTEVGDDQAYFVCFNGVARPRRKSMAMGSHGFRAVRDPPPD